MRRTILSIVMMFLVTFSFGIAYSDNINVKFLFQKSNNEYPSNFSNSNLCAAISPSGDPQAPWKSIKITTDNNGIGVIDAGSGNSSTYITSISGCYADKGKLVYLCFYGPSNPVQNNDSIFFITCKQFQQSSCPEPGC